MSTIEQAAKRLEQLRNAGIDVPESPILSVPFPDSAPSANDIKNGKPAARLGLPDSPFKPIGSAPTQRGPAEVGSLDHAPRASKEVEVDLRKLRLAGMVTPDSPGSKIADEFRVIKRPLIANAQGRAGAPINRGNVIMITSSLPKEGKSFVALNLAMSIAMEIDSRALVVDGDVASPSILELFGLSPSKGLLDLLADPQLDVSDVLLRTDVDRLTLLPAGTPHKRASELLASDAMVRLITDLAARYSDRIIVFDSPPLLATTEARVLASHMGQIVLVVRADRTSRGAVQESLALLAQCPVVSTLLNGASDSTVGSYYGYANLA